MVSNKSLDEYKVIAATLHDVHNVHGLVFNTRALRLTLYKVKSRVRSEGIGFLTKTLSRLGKAFDKAIAGHTPLNSVGKGYSFESQPGSQLPRFLGELFNEVLQPDGTLLQHPCAQCVKAIRQVCYLFYKYELPYSDEQEQSVLSRFKQTEEDLSALEASFAVIARDLSRSDEARRSRYKAVTPVQVAREAKIFLSNIFSYFDPLDIYPKHGPGAVATKQQLWEKYLWSNVSSRITKMYPLDAYYFASSGHVCDRLDTFERITDKDLPARVILVPKDSRGPRLISCEPVDFQWIQQGLGRAIVELVESHDLTKGRVNFTDQAVNRQLALKSSLHRDYVTLDLNEASDRVSLDLVRLLFPPHIYEYLEACRSLSTELPNGEVITLKKFAPMGSSLCFPILALTVWAILAAGAPDANVRKHIYVYGDDVIVPTAYAENAMKHLESFGLKINHDKSCTGGLFRESCGMDAFNGVDVTPVRLRTVWSSTRSPDVYTSWIAYANSFYDRQYFNVYNLIVEELLLIYKEIPTKDMNLSCPSLYEVPIDAKPSRHRQHPKGYQTLQWSVWDVKSRSINKEIDGWLMLLRYFANCKTTRDPLSSMLSLDRLHHWEHDLLQDHAPFSVRSYTRRRTSMLVRRWR